jgi:tRNA pseudouridine38-40 synthase
MLSEGFQRWCGLCAYDGTDFAGWQSQPGGNTVQDFLGRRLSQIFQCPIVAVGSGRTDAGVHARGQVFHFDAPPWFHGAPALLRALRCGFPKTIQVSSIAPAPSGFHARFSATGKRYIYVLQRGFADPFHCRHRWSLGDGPLDVNAMELAAPLFLGTHDFTAFSTGCSVEESSVRTLIRSEFVRSADCLLYVVEGNGFLYRMVRRIVGALVAVGRGVVCGDRLKERLEHPKIDCRPHLSAAPALGLTLDRVFYGDLEIFHRPAPPSSPAANWSPHVIPPE